MNDQPASITSWCEQVASYIERLAGSATREELLSTWEEHEARKTVEITLIGPYSSGKSSLLRRLLADQGLEVPEWCTVSARRETFELNEVAAGSVSFTDAPGFASTNLAHEQLAEDALALSDAFMLVVPPNLMTSRLPLAASFLSGVHYFGRPGGELANKVIAVIGQADTLGVDPEDDAAGMRALAERKSRELMSQLEDAGAGALAQLRVFVVAADPYEEQSRTRSPARESFDAFRDWDGIGDLAAAIASLADRRTELRAAAKLRYFSRIGRAVVDESSVVLERSKSAADDLQARSAELAQLRVRGDALVEAAEADLQARLVLLGTDMAEELTGADPDATTKVESAVAELVEQWRGRHDGEVDLFLGEAAAQIDRRLDRPTAQHTATFLRSLASDASGDDSQDVNSRVVRLLNDIHGDVEGVVRQSFELKMGRSIEKLLQDVESLKHPKSGGAGRASTGTAAPESPPGDNRKAGATTPDGQTKGASADSGETAAVKGSPKGTEATASKIDAAQAAQIANAGLQIAGGVLAIVTTIDAEVRQRKLDEAVRKERERARDALDQAATTLASNVVRGSGDDPGWSARLAAGLDVVRQSLGVPADAGAIDAAAAEVQRLAAELGDLRRLLEECPA